MLLYKIKWVAIFLCVITIIGAATAGYAQDNSGQINSWREAATAGDADAAVELGETYHNGWGVEKNEEEAFKWYLVAAKQGTDKGVAEFTVGQSYSIGRGVKQDYKEAFGWFKKAAAKGNVAAVNNVGSAYFLGQGTEQDKAKGISHFQSAATQGNADAQYNLAEAYFNGNGVPKDEQLAMTLYKQAMEKGHALAHRKLMELSGTTKSMFSAENISSHWKLIVIAVLVGCCLVFFR